MFDFYPGLPHISDIYMFMKYVELNDAVEI